MHSSDSSNTNAMPIEVFTCYKFGMLIPEFFTNATHTYLFGFYGMMRDDEVKDLGGYTVPPNEGVGNSYDFGAILMFRFRIICLN